MLRIKRKKSKIDCETFILDVVWEHCSAVRDILHPQVDEFLNYREVPGDHDERLAALWSLFERRMVKIFYGLTPYKGGCDEFKRIAIHEAKRTESGWESYPSLLYGLSRNGGQRWLELLDYPDWDKYINMNYIEEISDAFPVMPSSVAEEISLRHSCSHKPTQADDAYCESKVAINVVSISSSSRESVDEFIRLMSLAADNVILVPRPSDLRQLSPWHATYWKRMRTGYQTIIAYSPTDRRPEQLREYFNWPWSPSP